jgi:hypothetical protein
MNKPPSNREMSLKVEDLVCNPHKIAEALKLRQWEVLSQLSDFLNSPLPKDLPQTDPARFRRIMAGLTECYVLGWHKLNKTNLKNLQKKEK